MISKSLQTNRLATSVVPAASINVICDSIPCCILHHGRREYIMCLWSCLLGKLEYCHIFSCDPVKHMYRVSDLSHGIISSFPASKVCNYCKAGCYCSWNCVLMCASHAESSGAATSVDNPRYFVAVQHEGCHCRGLSAVISCETCLLLSLLLKSHALGRNQL